MTPAAQQKDWRHGQPRRWFEADDTPLLAEGHGVVPAPPERQQGRQPKRLPEIPEIPEIPQRVRNAIESLMSMTPPPRMTGHLPSHSQGEERPAMR